MSEMNANIPSKNLGEKHQSVLNEPYIYEGNMFMDYLYANPELFLKKRIQWKANKIIGKRRLLQGVTSKYYRQSFSELFYETDRIEAFVELCRQEYNIEESSIPEVVPVQYLYEYFKDWGKVLFAVIRPAHIYYGTLKGYTIQYYLDINMEFVHKIKWDASLSGLLEFILSLDTNQEIISLVQPNYKEILANRKYIEAVKAANQYYNSVSAEEVWGDSASSDSLDDYVVVDDSSEPEVMDCFSAPSRELSACHKDVLSSSPTSLSDYYMEYIRSNPELLLKKRVEWKASKILGKRKLVKGLNANYYPRKFTTLYYETDRIEAFVKLARQEYNIIESTVPEAVPVQYLYEHFKDWGKVLFCIIRPACLALVDLKGHSVMEYINENIDFIRLLFKAPEMVGLRDYMLSIDLRDDIISLIQPNYKEILRNKHSLVAHGEFHKY